MSIVISSISTFVHAVLSHVLPCSDVTGVLISETKNSRNLSERLFRGTDPVEPLRDGAVVPVSQTGSSVKVVSSKVSGAVRRRFRRALRDVVYLFKGSSLEAYPLQSWYFPEALDPMHRYGKQLRLYYEAWRTSDALQSFNMWMCQLEVGQNVPGKEELLKKDLLTPEGMLPLLKVVTYLRKEELSRYEMKIDDQGRVYTEEYFEKNKKPFDSAGCHKEGSFIYVISPEGKVYIGAYSRGCFNHSSFLAGRPVKSAGFFIFENGKIKELLDDSGHYSSGSKELSRKTVRKTLEILSSKGIPPDGIKLSLNTKNGKERSFMEVESAQYLTSPFWLGLEKTTDKALVK